MTWNDHDHRGEYAETGHTHNFWDLNDAAERHHRHYDLENDDEKAQRRITGLQDEINGLRRQLDDALDRIRALEADTPQARQLQLEADLAAADLAESGYDRHGRDCRCSYCATDDEPEPVEYDPGPEVDDEGGMSEYRYAVTPEEPWSP
jgi:hypothetical protein